MKPYRYVAAFVLVLGFVAVAPAFAGETPAPEPSPAVAVEPVAPQPVPASQAEPQPAEPATASEACASEALPAPLQLETRVLNFGINCSNCTSCDFAGQRCSCGDPGNTCKGTCQAIGPTFVCLHSCACD